MKPPLGAPIDRSHPLAQGLVSAFVLNEGVGAPRESLTQARADTAPTGTAPGWTAAPNSGVALSGNGTDACRTAASYVTTYPFTISIRMYLAQLPVGINYVPASLGTAASSNFAEFKFPAGDTIKYRLNGGTASVDVSLGSPAVLTEYALTGRSASGTDHAGFQDFTKATSTTDAGTMTLDSIVFLGEMFNGNLFNAHSGGVFLCYVWNRALADDHIYWIHREPYAFFTTPMRRAAKPAAAAPATTSHFLTLLGVGA